MRLGTLRWLSLVSLVLLLVSGAVFVLQGALVAAYPGLAPGQNGAILSFEVFPITAWGLSLLSGVLALVLCAQHRHWGWFIGVLIGYLVFVFAALEIYASGILQLLIAVLPAIPSDGIVNLVLSVGTVLPIAILALVYAWTRRQPAPASA